jgi:hypothetical protein
MGMRFGTWNVRRIHRAGSLRAMAEEISNDEVQILSYTRESYQQLSG